MAELVYVRRYSPALLAERIITLILAIVELLLAVRFVLELLAANMSAPFVAWIYGASSGLVSPFAGAFPSLSLGGGYVIDLSAALAMIVYAFIAWAVVQLLGFAFSSVA